MEVRLHKNATTTLSIREEIKRSKLKSINAIAKKYNISWYTAKRQKERDPKVDIDPARKAKSFLV